MSASKPMATAISVPVAPQTQARNAAEKTIAAAQGSKVHSEIDTDSERMRTTIIRMTSSSASELDGLVSEIQEVREFLNSESERVQREIANYAQLNQRALAVIKMITQTISPWKSTPLEKDEGTLLGEHEAATDAGGTEP